jgi:hypothetical protein
MSADRRGAVRCNASHPGVPLWLIGWLFTIGYLKLAFWNGVLAIIIWPYYIGVAVR